MTHAPPRQLGGDDQRNRCVEDVGKRGNFGRDAPPIGAQTVVWDKDDEPVTGVTKLELGNEGTGAW